MFSDTENLERKQENEADLAKLMGQIIGLLDCIDQPDRVRRFARFLAMYS